MKDFLNQLKERIVIFSGAIGTELHKRNLRDRCLDYYNLSKPKTVRELLKEYKKAGAPGINIFVRTKVENIYRILEALE